LAKVLLTIKECVWLTVLHTYPILTGAFIIYFINTFWRRLRVLAYAAFFFDAKYFVANSIVRRYAVFNTAAFHFITRISLTATFLRDLTKTWIVRIIMFANILASKELVLFAVLDTISFLNGTLIVKFLRTFQLNQVVLAEAAFFFDAKISVTNNIIT